MPSAGKFLKSSITLPSRLVAISVSFSISDFTARDLPASLKASFITMSFFLVLGVIQRVDMVGSTRAGLGHVDKIVGAAEKVLDNRAVRFAEHVPVVGGHVRAARGVTEMARTVVDTGNQLTNSADVLSQSSQVRREVARSGWSAARNAVDRKSVV